MFEIILIKLFFLGEVKYRRATNKGKFMYLFFVFWFEFPVLGLLFRVLTFQVDNSQHLMKYPYFPPITSVQSQVGQATGGLNS